MKSFILFIAIIFAYEIVSAQSFDISTQKGVDMGRYKTFNVVKGEIASNARKINNDEFYAEFKNFVVREMEKKGYLLSNDSADISISYVVQISEQMETQDLGPLGGTPVDNAALVDQPNHWSREFTEGTLIIDVENNSKKTSEWTATGTMDVTKARGAKLLDRCVRNAFKKFPKRKTNKKG